MQTSRFIIPSIKWSLPSQQYVIHPKITTFTTLWLTLGRGHSILITSHMDLQTMPLSSHQKILNLLENQSVAELWRLVCVIPYRIEAFHFVSFWNQGLLLGTPPCHEYASSRLLPVWGQTSVLVANFTSVAIFLPEIVSSQYAKSLHEAICAIRGLPLPF